jgi:hypothetical protein
MFKQQRYFEIRPGKATGINSVGKVFCQFGVNMGVFFNGDCGINAINLRSLWQKLETRNWKQEVEVATLPILYQVARSASFSCFLSLFSSFGHKRLSL